ncbi:MAG: arsenic resistance protein [Candidatus Methanomethylophilaceae archaeon]|nr:arsenic resistance protein [Candidatus Methanomethylophilaceae archaeon]
MGHEAWIHTGVMLSAAAIGLALGSFTVFGDFSASLIEPFLMLMLFLVFLSIDMGRMRESFTNLRFLSSAVAINFVVTPLVSFMLGLLFFGGSVDLRIGLIMLLVTPCTDWYLVFTSVSKGNVDLSSTLLPVNLFLQIVLMPVYLLVFMGTSVEFDMAGMLVSMAVVLLVPFLAALAVKLLSPKVAAISKGKDFLGENCDNLQLFFLCLAIVAMFASESDVLFDNLDMMLAMLAPLMIFFVLTYIVSSATARVQGYSFDDTTSLIFTTMARNSPLSLAIAVAVFPDSPLISLVLVIGPLLELPVLSITSNIRLNLRNKSRPIET